VTAQWRVAPAEWGSPDGAECLRIRMEVFVAEQGVPEEMETDDIDPVAYHVLARGADGSAAGTGRLYADATDPATAHIGRMAVRRPARATGCGAAIMQALMDEARRRGFRRVVLSAQTHAQGFYARFGFKPFGEVYPDCNIPHIDMEARLQGAEKETKP
jgi:predicted GNAT family N-acyltransferase